MPIFSFVSLFSLDRRYILYCRGTATVLILLLTLIMTGAPIESLDILIKTYSQRIPFIILRHLDQQRKAQFRFLERLFERITKLKSHLIFNETCINNQLLPTYICALQLKNVSELLFACMVMCMLICVYWYA